MVMKSSEFRTVSPIDFRRELQIVDQRFEGNKQHDAQETLNIILECLEKEFTPPEETPKEENKISEIFDGEMKEIITCNKCKQTSKPIDPFRFLHVEVPERSSTLNDCISYGMREEMMEDKACLKCNNSTEAQKKTLINKLPETLVVHLKRFCYEGKWMKKIHTNRFSYDFGYGDIYRK